MALNIAYHGWLSVFPQSSINMVHNHCPRFLLPVMSPVHFPTQLSKGKMILGGYDQKALCDAYGLVFCLELAERFRRAF